MIKIIEKQLDISAIKASMAFAMIYYLLFNSIVAFYKFSHCSLPFFSITLELGKQFLYIYIMLFVYFFGFAIHRKLFIAGALILFLTGAVASYYLFFFNIAPTVSKMAVLYSTDLSGIYESITVRLLVWIIFSLAICIYSLHHFRVQTSNVFVSKILSVVCLFLMINSIISPQFKELKTYFPVQYLHSSYVYFSNS